MERVADADGLPHTFEIRSMLVATGHEMDALEITIARQLGYPIDNGSVRFTKLIKVPAIPQSGATLQLTTSAGREFAATVTRSIGTRSGRSSWCPQAFESIDSRRRMRGVVQRRRMDNDAVFVVSPTNPPLQNDCR